MIHAERSAARREAPPESLEHVLLYDVSWEAYEAILAAMGDRRLRHSYDGGTLEIMSPLKRHDGSKKLLARLLEAMTLELMIPIQSLGSTTLRRRSTEKGCEPDECYYVAHEAEVRLKPDYEPEVDPPPDLALEIDVTHSFVDRLGIYAALGVPEIWRVRRGKVTFHRLGRGGKYAEVKKSVAFPFLTAATQETFLAQQYARSETAIVADFRDHVRQHYTK